jgi:hypothetical protein
LPCIRASRGGSPNRYEGYTAGTQRKPHAFLISFQQERMVEAGGVEPPSEKLCSWKNYMLIPFALSLRRRPSGTGNNEPPASLIPSLTRESRPRAFRREAPDQPALMTSLSARRAGRRRRAALIRQREQTACWQLCVPRRSRVVWPPACLPSARASVETGTPPNYDFSLGRGQELVNNGPSLARSRAAGPQSVSDCCLFGVY